MTYIHYYNIHNMLYCTIDGQVAYPDTSEKIKVTYGNPSVNDSGEYTYEMTFPMAILSNYAIFRAANRLEVTKTLEAYEDVKLYADNRMVISGKGTVTAITDEAVKIQVVGGKSRIKYDSRFERHFIDEMDLGSAPEFTWKSETLRLFSSNVYRFVELDRDKAIIGEQNPLRPGSFNYVFAPVYDETNSMSKNLYLHDPKMKRRYFIRPAVQPNLFYVFRKVMEAEGFSVDISALENTPFANLYVASARGTLRLAKALPHWTVYTFMEEFRKLFNATMVINDAAKKVTVVTKDELETSETVTYEMLDEYSTEYDEDGLKSFASSNIEYDLEESENRSGYDVVPLEVQREFPPRDVADINEVNTVAAGMTTKETLTTLFRFTGGSAEGLFLYYDSSGEKATRRLAGFFSPLVRDKDSDETVKLLITPAAYDWVQRWGEDNAEDMGWVEYHQFGQGKTMPLISVSNEKECPSDQMTYDDEDGEYYVSVADAMAGTEVEEGEDTDEKMKLFFLSNYDYNWVDDSTPLRYSAEREGENLTARCPLAYTDCRNVLGIGNALDISGVILTGLGSLSLQAAAAADTIGNYQAGTTQVRNKMQLVIKFITEDIPDPANIYIFHNRRYLCSKIEMEVSNDGVSKVKTGYFYEMG